MTTHDVLMIIFAALTFEAVFIATIVAIVVAITKKNSPPADQATGGYFSLINGQPLNPAACVL
jgi:hypothetical protein